MHQGNVVLTQGQQMKRDCSPNEMWLFNKGSNCSTDEVSVQETKWLFKKWSDCWTNEMWLFNTWNVTAQQMKYDRSTKEVTVQHMERDCSTICDAFKVRHTYEYKLQWPATKFCTFPSSEWARARWALHPITQDISNESSPCSVPMLGKPLRLYTRARWARSRLSAQSIIWKTQTVVHPMPKW